MRRIAERRALGALAALWAVAACGDRLVSPGDGEEPDVALELVVGGLSQPVHVVAAPGDADRLFVVEQTGRIRVVRDGALLATPFLDLSGLITAGGERGLLSMAFHPAYPTDNRFFVFYTGAAGATVVAEYAAPGDADVADPASARVLLSVDQPFSNHNGGLVRFGPDGFLYIGLGDGGSGGDPLGHGQDTGTLLGAILRIDIDAPAGTAPYAVPPDNPFVGTAGARPEIWAYGLRNPWRFAFDPQTGELYIGDVGQNRWEEVNVAPAGAAGLNYGWNVMEASECFDAASCDTAGLVLPVHEYRTGQEGCAVTGGEVYRGDDMPALRGVYFFSDYCQGWLRSFRHEGGQAVDFQERIPASASPGNVTSFGTDARGEVYLTTHQGGIYRLVAGEAP
jgi:glucose/arabinose dehydrogenase